MDFLAREELGISGNRRRRLLTGASDKKNLGKRVKF